MALNDNYKVIVSGHYLGQLCQNIFWYSQENGGGGIPDLTELCEFVRDEWCLALDNFQSDLFEWDDLVATNWYTGLESVSLPITIPGLSTSEGLPAWFVYNLSWNRAGAGYNYPSKRVSGVAEAYVEDGDIEATAKAAMVLIAGNMVECVTSTGVRYGMRAFSPAPDLGENPYIPPFRFQAVTAARSAVLGTQKTRK